MINAILELVALFIFCGTISVVITLIVSKYLHQNQQHYPPPDVLNWQPGWDEWWSREEEWTK